MKHTLIALSLGLVVTSLAGCGSSTPTKESETKAVVTIDSYFESDKKYDFEFELTKDMFEQDSSHFSKDLALFAYGTALATHSKDMIKKFYQDGKFDHIKLSDSYDVEPTTTSVAYAFAHKKMNGRDLVSVTIRGFEYKKEWADNFDLGLEGEHYGFAARADVVNAALKEYVEANKYSKNNTTILLSGYSRAGAISNLLAKRLNDSELVASKANIYTYTFEAPKAALEKGNYNNIYNIASSGDLITYFAPAQYGFTRYGVDIDLYTTDIDNYMKEFDPSINFPAFSEDLKDTCEDDKAVAKYIINGLTAYEQDPEDETSPRDIATREHFAVNYGATLGYMLSLIFSLKESTMDAIKAKIASMSLGELMGLLAEDGLYNLLNPFVEADGYPYQPEELRVHCNTILEFISGPGIIILPFLLIGGDVFTRIIAQHYPETNYVLLKKMENN